MAIKKKSGRAPRSAKPSDIEIELRGGWRPRRGKARLVKVIPEADPWDATRGTIDLRLEVRADGFPKGEGQYRLAEPMISGKDLAGQIEFLREAIARKTPISISEMPGRTCQCGSKVSSPFCPSCGTQVYADTAAPCQPETHGRIQQRVAHCPFCGRYLGDPDGGRRFRRVAP